MAEESEIGLTPRERRFLEENPQAQMSSEAASKKTPETPAIGGWLGFLVFVLLFINPVLNIGFTVYEIGRADPGISLSPLWQQIRIWIWAWTLVLCAISILAGWLLQKRLQPSTPAIVIALLWVIGPIGVLAESLLASVVFDINFDFNLIGASIGRAVAFASIWTLYLLLSKRVEKTYRVNAIADHEEIV